MNHHSLLRSTLNVAVALAVTGASQASFAAISIDLHLDNKKTIDATSLQFGVGVGISTATERFRDREVSRPSLSDITWTQSMDTTYPLLLRKTLTGDNKTPAKIDLRTTGVTKPYLSLTAEHAGLTGMSLTNSSVSGSMNFEKLSMTYDPAGLDKIGSKITTSYDLRTLSTDGAASRAAKSLKGTTPSVSRGDTSIYLRLGSGSTAIAGESTATGYENWIRIDSAQMGVGMEFSAIDRSGPRVAVKQSLSELTISRQFDSTVPVVFSALLQGVDIGEATIEYVTGTQAGPVTFMQLSLQHVMFSGLSLSTGGDLPSVSESLNFTGFSQTVWEIDDHGKRVKETSVGYDFTSRSQMAIDPLAGSVPGFGKGNLTGGVTSAASSVSDPLTAPQPIPEPGTWLMMLAGLGMLGGVARRRASA